MVQKHLKTDTIKKGMTLVVTVKESYFSKAPLGGKELTGKVVGTFKLKAVKSYGADVGDRFFSFDCFNFNIPEENK